MFVTVVDTRTLSCDNPHHNCMQVAKNGQSKMKYTVILVAPYINMDYT